LFAFIENDGIPWHNNAAERALRHLAVQRKISGVFSEQSTTTISWSTAIDTGRRLRQGTGGKRKNAKMNSKPEREGKVASGVTAEFSRFSFELAADRYLAEVALQRPGSVRKSAQMPGGDPRKSWEGDLMERLRPFFVGKRLNQITADDVRAYQAERIGKGKHPNTVNHEVKALLRLLKRAKLLSRIRDDVKLLPVKREPRQMLTPAEKQRKSV
jgi:hypothetical protein